MELECGKCGRKFEARSAKSEFCEHCVADEFEAQIAHPSTEEDFEDEEQTRAEFLKENARIQKRQEIRARKLKEELEETPVMSAVGKIRFFIGLIIFIFTISVVLLNNDDKAANTLLNLTSTAMRTFTIVFSIIAAIFVFTSSKRHQFFRYTATLVMLVGGYYAVDILGCRAQTTNADTFLPEEAYEQNKVAEAPTGRILTDDELKNYLELNFDKRSRSAYAIFVDQPDPVFRTQIRDYIHRFMQAECTTIYSRKRGYLYIVENAPFPTKDISPLVAKFGKIYYKDLDRGIYEIEYNAETSHMSNRYSQDVINTPSHPAFIAANIDELQCKVPERIARAAESLAAANSAILRTDILDSLTTIIEEPWTTEPATYDKLITALITYSSDKNAHTIAECMKYFEWNIANKKSTSSLIVNYLIEVAPNDVANLIIDQWMLNPIVWNSFLEKLGGTAEELLIKKLAVTRDLQIVGSIIHHFGQYGSAKTLPYLERLATHSDKLINQSAKKAKLLVESRVGKTQ